MEIARVFQITNPGTAIWVLKFDYQPNSDQIQDFSSQNIKSDSKILGQKSEYHSNCIGTVRELEI